jgi:hypothetical protein
VPGAWPSRTGVLGAPRRGIGRPPQRT